MGPPQVLCRSRRSLHGSTAIRMIWALRHVGKRLPKVIVVLADDLASMDAFDPGLVAHIPENLHPVLRIASRDMPRPRFDDQIATMVEAPYYHSMHNPLPLLLET